ncbi:MAG TPA: hypothetical protein VGQ22_19925 [Steroidobacteraceae bacterium]|jgi:hypothetical protein|nr:hypothetical protein [Steroidobacteraceae bacterium]
MNTMNTFSRKLLVFSLLSVGLATTSVTQAGTQLVGPRNTIAQTQSVKQSANRLVDRLQASRDGASACQVVRIAHHGHPGKGVNRVERIDVPCGQTRLSTR